MNKEMWLRPISV